MKTEINVTKILNKFQYNYWRYDVNLLTFRSLMRLLNDEQLDTLLTVCEINKNDLEKLDLEVPNKNKFIKPYRYRINGSRFVRITPALWEDFKKMNYQLNEYNSDELIIKSGYRSPAYQSLLFLKEYYSSNFNMDKTKKIIKIPGKSEHQNVNKLAIDMTSKNKKNVSLNTYKWLNKNAIKYNFINSYPEKNKNDMEFEPWHWSYRP